MLPGEWLGSEAAPELVRVEPAPEPLLVVTAPDVLALLQAVITSIMAEKDRIDRARRIDQVSRFVFPALFVVLYYLTLHR